MTNKLLLVAAYRKTRLVYQLNNNFYHVDINEIEDTGKPCSEFKIVNSKTKNQTYTERKKNMKLYRFKSEYVFNPNRASVSVRRNGLYFNTTNSSFKIT